MHASTRSESQLVDLSRPFQVIDTNTDDFLLAMASIGPYKDINLVGSYADPDDQTARTAHRDKDLPWHRDGIRSKAIADMQGGNYIEAPNVDVVGMYCIRDNQMPGSTTTRTPCYTVLAEALPDADPYDDSQFTIVAEVDLRPGQALVWDNRLWHRRHGPVGSRVLIRFWSTCPALYEVRP